MKRIKDVPNTHLKIPPVSSKDEGTWHCVYCGKEVAEEHSECCSEVGHTEFVPSGS